MSEKEIDLPIEAKVTALRTVIPVLDSVTYLNTGGAGPLPHPVLRAVCATAERQGTEPRTGSSYYERLTETEDECRDAIGNILGCQSTQIALTHNTTEGMNLVTLGVNWQPGDEAITTNIEHLGGLVPLWVVRDRYGVTVKIANMRTHSVNPVDAIARLITHRTKLISLSHVSYSTGQVLPIREIAQEAHRRGVLVLVDGAQAFAAMELDIQELEVDFYSVPGQKWLLGPDGTGALYSSQSALSQIRTTFAGYGTVDGYNDHGGLLVKEDGRRFEQGTANLPALAGQLAAATWLTRDVGASWAYNRIQHLAAFARELLSHVDGVEVITGEQHAGLIVFRIEGTDHKHLASRLSLRDILVRAIPQPEALRISVSFFTTEDEIRTLVDAVTEDAVAIRRKQG